MGIERTLKRSVPERKIIEQKTLTQLALVILFHCLSFILEHYLLLLVPIYLIYTGRFVVFPLSFSYAVFSYALFCLFHSFVLSGLGLLTGHNLNYMLVPPNCKFFFLALDLILIQMFAFRWRALIQLTNNMCVCLPHAI